MDKLALLQSQVSQPKVYTDMQGLSGLKNAARENDPEALREVAQQFEGVFLQMVLKSMRKANEAFKSDLMGSFQMDQYEEMYHQQLALSLSEGEGIGLAKVLMEQMGDNFIKGAKDLVESDQAATREGRPTSLDKVEMLLNKPNKSFELNKSNFGIPLEQETAQKPFPLPKGNIFSEQRIADMINGKQGPSGQEGPLAMVGARAPEGGIQFFNNPVEKFNQVVEAVKDIPAKVHQGMRKVRKFASPEEFAKVLLPKARAVAEQLGVDPKVLVAQAALETGWGRSVIQSRDGVNSHNLFGIKSHNWGGDTITTATHEYRGGRRMRERAAFRSYDSYEHSFADYLSFLTKNPRYSRALQSTNDPRAFTQALQDAGYATDPNYSRKIMKLFNSNAIQNAMY